MKRKLLFAMLCIVSVLGIQAAQTPEVGRTYYLYNPTTGLFLSRGARYGCAVWGDNFGIPVTLVANGNGFRLLYLDSNNQYVSDAYWSWADGGTDRAQTYTLSPQGNNQYKLINTAHGDNRTLYINEGGEGGFSRQIASNGMYGDNCNVNWDVWEFLSSDERENILAEKKAKIESEVASAADLSLEDKKSLETLLTEQEFTVVGKTSVINNAALTHNNDGWSFANTSGGNPVGKDGNGVEVFEGSGVFSQTINNLRPGIYKVSLSAFFRDGSNANCYKYKYSNEGGWRLSNAYLEANGNQTMIADWASDCTSDNAPNDPGAAKPLFDDGKYLNEVFTTVGDDGKLTINIAQPGAAVGSRWFLMTNAKLTYYVSLAKLKELLAAGKTTATELLNDATYNNITGSERIALTTANNITPEETTPEEAVESYWAAIDEVNAAIDAFKNAKTGYDELVKEIAKAKALGMENDAVDKYAATAETTAAKAVTNTQDLKVDEYDYVTENYKYGVTLGEWVSEGVNTQAADFDNQHWSGETRKYKNQADDNNQGWNAKSWSINFNQDITLPAGKYVFKVAGRQESGAIVTSLVVKKGEEVLGSVDDFPRSNNSRGINKKGETSFTGSDEDFANNGIGFGWEWRYVKFEIEEREATVNIAINSVATAEHQWVSFGDYTVQSDNEATISMIAYNIALRDAKAAIENESYNKVTGLERTELDAAIKAEPGTSKDAIEAATKSLKDATETFIAAKANYDKFYDAFIAEIDKAETLGVDVSDAKEKLESGQITGADLPNDVYTLKVAEYNLVVSDYQYSVELGAWNTEGSTGEEKGQHWSGDNDRKYLEQSQEAWGWDSWSIKYSQDLTLPKGEYVFKVAGRKKVGNGCTLELVVTDNDAQSVLGTVMDFPEGDTGLGINKEGATSFKPEDPDGFANNGAGRGWEWRYVKFVLDKETSVKVAVSAEATIKEQWVSFCDATVQTDDEATISMIAYNIALRDAQATIENESYDNVTGSERTQLEEAINANPGTSKEEIDAATEDLKTATSAFTGSLAAYNDLLAAKDEAKEFVPEKLPYASDEKYDAINTAVDVTADSGEDASAKAANIRKAYRSYIESNAMAEGVATAEDKTSLIVNPLFTDGSTNGWTSSFGEIGTNDNQSFTDGEGNAGYIYCDRYASNINELISQTITGLEAGRYLLTVTGRGSTALKSLKLTAAGQSENIPYTGDVNGQFGMGWNDVSLEFNYDGKEDLTIGVNIEGPEGNAWYSFTRVRLVKLADIVEVKIDAGKYATRIFPFVPEFGEESDVVVYSCPGIKENGASLDLVPVEGELSANTPYILYSEKGYNKTLSGEVVPTEETEETEVKECKAGVLVGIISGSKEINRGYVLQTLNGVQAFYKVNADDPITVPTYRAYINLGTAEVNALSLTFPDGNTTAVEAVAAETRTVDVYSISGVLVRKAVKDSEALNGLQPGIYIVNGVKKVVK